MSLNFDSLKRSFSGVTTITPTIEPSVKPLTPPVSSLNLPVGPLNPAKTYSPPKESFVSKVVSAAKPYLENLPSLANIPLDIAKTISNTVSKLAGKKQPFPKETFTEVLAKDAFKISRDFLSRSTLDKPSPLEKFIPKKKPGLAFPVSRETIEDVVYKPTTVPAPNVYTFIDEISPQASIQRVKQAQEIEKYYNSEAKKRKLTDEEKNEFALARLTPAIETINWMPIGGFTKKAGKALKFAQIADFSKDTQRIFRAAGHTGETISQQAAEDVLLNEAMNITKKNITEIGTAFPKLADKVEVPPTAPAKEYKSLLDTLKKDDEIVTISKTSGTKNTVKFVSTDDKGVTAIDPTSGLPMRFRHELFDFTRPSKKVGNLNLPPITPEITPGSEITPITTPRKEAFIKQGLDPDVAELFVKFEDSQIKPSGSIPFTPEASEVINKVDVKKVPQGKKHYLAAFNEKTGKIEDVNAKPSDIFHEQVHAWIENTPEFNEIHQDFQKDFDILKKTDAKLQLIEEILIKDQKNYGKMSPKDLTEERFSYIAEMYGGKGLDSIPKELQKYYVSLFEMSAEKVPAGARTQVTDLEKPVPIRLADGDIITTEDISKPANLKPINFPTEKTKTKTPFESGTIRSLTETEKLVRAKIDDLMAGKTIAEKLSDIPSAVSKDGKIRPLILSHKILNKFVTDHGLNMSLDNLVINANDWDYLIKNFRGDENSINIIKEIPDSDNFLTIGARRQNGFFALTHYETITKSSNKLKNLLEKGEVLVNTSGASSPTMKQILSGSDSMGRIKFTVFDTNISNLPPKTESVKPLDIEALPQDKEISEDGFLKFLTEDKKEYDQMRAAQEAAEKDIAEDVPLFTKAEEAAARRENLIFPNDEMETQYHKFRARYFKFATKPEDVVQFKSKVPESENWFYTQEGDQYDSDIYDLFVERYNAEKEANQISRPKYKKQLSQAELKSKLETREIKKETMERLRAIYINKVTQIRERANNLLKGIKASEKRRREELIAENARKSQLSALKERIIAREKINKIETAKQVVERRRAFVKSIQRHFGLSDNDVRSITQRDIRLMTDYDFSGFLEDLRRKSQELAVWNQAKDELVTQIKIKHLNVDSLREAMKLPQIKDMTLGELHQLNEALKPFQAGDVFFSKRKLETIDRTKLKGLRTFREVQEYLAKETGLTPENVQDFRIGMLDRMMGPSGLMEKHPLWDFFIKELWADRFTDQAEFFALKDKINKITSKIPTTLYQKLIPRQPNIGKWIESHKKEIITREALAGQEKGLLTYSLDKTNIKISPQEMEFIKTVQPEFLKIYNELVAQYALNPKTPPDRYIPHAPRGFLETLTDSGPRAVVKELFKKYKLEEVSFGIIDDTKQILAYDKWFANTISRVRNKDYALVPTQNYIKASLDYFERWYFKKSLDKMVPFINIVSDALSKRGTTKTGLLLHPEVHNFMNEWLNNQKGRVSSKYIKQGSFPDVVFTTLRHGTAIMNLGWKISANIINQFGEQIPQALVLGPKNFVIAKIRAKTPRGQRIINKYRNFIGENPWYETFIAPMRAIESRVGETFFIGMRDADYSKRRNILLGSMTDAEWKSETISVDRLAEIKTQASRFTNIGEEKPSLFGATTEVKGFKQHKAWAISLLSMTARNLKYTTQFAITFGKTEGPRAKRAMFDLMNAAWITGLGLMLYGFIKDKEDDDTIIGRQIKILHREALSLFNAIDPRFWLGDGRGGFLVPSLTRIIQLLDAIRSLWMQERYTTSKWGEYKAGDLKAGNKFEKIITPGFIKESSSIPEKQLKDVKKEISNDIKSGRLTIPAAKTKFINEMKKIQAREKKQRFTLSLKEYKADLKKRITSKELTVADAKEEFLEYSKKNPESFNSDNEKSFIDKIVLAGKAIGADPIEAFEYFFNDEIIRRVDNDAIIVYRGKSKTDQGQLKFSTEKRKEFGATKGMILDHKISLELAGDNSNDNLWLVSIDDWARFTPMENYLGVKLRAGLIDKKTAQQLILGFKTGKLTEKDIKGF